MLERQEFEVAMQRLLDKFWSLLDCDYEIIQAYLNSNGHVLRQYIKLLPFSNQKEMLSTVLSLTPELVSPFIDLYVKIVMSIPILQDALVLKNLSESKRMILTERINALEQREHTVKETTNKNSTDAPFVLPTDSIYLDQNMLNFLDLRYKDEQKIAPDAQVIIKKTIIGLFYYVLNQDKTTTQAWTDLECKLLNAKKAKTQGTALAEIKIENPNPVLSTSNLNTEPEGAPQRVATQETNQNSADAPFVLPKQLIYLDQSMRIFLDLRFQDNKKVPLNVQVIARKDDKGLFYFIQNQNNTTTEVWAALALIQKWLRENKAGTQGTVLPEVKTEHPNPALLRPQLNLESNDAPKPVAEQSTNINNTDSTLASSKDVIYLSRETLTFLKLKYKDKKKVLPDAQVFAKPFRNGFQYFVQNSDGPPTQVWKETRLYCLRHQEKHTGQTALPEIKTEHPNPVLLSTNLDLESDGATQSVVAQVTSKNSADSTLPSSNHVIYLEQEKIKTLSLRCKDNKEVPLDAQVLAIPVGIGFRYLLQHKDRSTTQVWAAGTRRSRPQQKRQWKKKACTSPEQDKHPVKITQQRKRAHPCTEETAKNKKNQHAVSVEPPITASLIEQFLLPSDWLDEYDIPLHAPEFELPDQGQDLNLLARSFSWDTIDENPAFEWELNDPNMETPTDRFFADDLLTSTNTMPQSNPSLASVPGSKTAPILANVGLFKDLNPPQANLRTSATQSLIDKQL